MCKIYPPNHLSSFSFNYSKNQVGTQVEYRKILVESTSKDPWNVSNTKLQVLADHTYNWYVYFSMTYCINLVFIINRDDYQVIMKHLWEKLTLKPKEWKRIAKAIHVMDYLVKNGAPRVV